MIDYKIFTIGFSSFEKTKLEAFFGLAEKRAPHWRLATRLTEARVILLNATADQDIENLRLEIASWQKVIVVGSSSFGTDWPVLRRPFKLMAVLTLLDKATAIETIVPTRQSAKPKTNSPMQPLTRPFVVPFASVAAPRPVALKQSTNSNKSVHVINPISIPKRLSPSHLISDIVARELTKGILESVAAKDTVIGRVLLVDDSDIALKYMQNRLRQFSYECELAHSGEEALALMAKHNYHFVFLDVMMAGLDGYQTCKAIKSNKTRRGPAPVVVMLTSRGGTIDKIRGTMSGCDAYLTKPLNDKRLGEVLAKFDFSTITQRWEAAHPYQPLIDTGFNAKKLLN